MHTQVTLIQVEQEKKQPRRSPKLKANNKLHPNTDVPTHPSNTNIYAKQRKVSAHLEFLTQCPTNYSQPGNTLGHHLPKTAYTWIFSGLLSPWS